MPDGQQVTWDQPGAAPPQVKWDEPKPPLKPGFLRTMASDVGSMLKPLNPVGFLTDPNAKPQKLGDPTEMARVAMTERRAAGQSAPRALAETAYEGLGANMQGFDTAAKAGETRQALAHLLAPGALALATRGASELAPALPDVARFGMESLGEGKDYLGRSMRTPQGKLTPGVRATARVGGGLIGSTLGTGGTIVGGLVGPTLADLMIPSHPNPEGWYARLPNRMPRLALPPATEPNLQVGGLGTDFPKPLRPLIGTPEDWSTYDRQMGILGEEASDAGMYHAARGSARKTPNLQVRLGKQFRK